MGQARAGCWIPELTDPAWLPGDVLPELQPQPFPESCTHSLRGSASGGQGREHQHFLQSSQDAGCPCPSYVPSPHPHSSEVPPLTPSPPGHSAPHPASAQPLPDLAPASLVSTVGCRSGHPLALTSAWLPAIFSFLQERPPEPSTAWPHSPQYLPPPATKGSVMSRMCCFQTGRPSLTQMKN